MMKSKIQNAKRGYTRIKASDLQNVLDDLEGCYYSEGYDILQSATPWVAESYKSLRKAIADFTLIKETPNAKT